LKNQADIVESLFRHAIKKRDSIAFNRGMKCKKFVNKYRSEIIAENAWNCELDVPLDYESYYSTSDKETNTLGK